MRRTLLKIAILALTFGLGVGVSVCWQLYQWSLVPYEVSRIPPWPFGSATRSVNEITIVSGIDACWVQANSHTIELSDGTQITQSCETLPSPLAVARALRTRLRNAEVAERTVDPDLEQILVTSPRVMRLSVYGNNLCVTEAPSLKHLLLYEAGALH